MRDAAEWQIGDVIAGLYRVVEVHRQGAMGLVYRVRHRGWNIDLAVKSPRPALFRDDAAKQRFVAEARTWVSLGLHPHVCACHYVRTIDGVPRVFAEYVDGGSLREWIKDRRLYQGAPAEVLARILDVAVQVAWGLDHAHRRGVVHQDVKPDNILIDGDGTAKITDFGLARARDVVDNHGPGDDQHESILVTVGGETPKYASPEQRAGEPIGHRSDVFSFAVTVLEMFTGDATWAVGPAASHALAEYRRHGPAEPDLPPMPRAVDKLLTACLREDPTQRPGRLDELATELAGISGLDRGDGLPRRVLRPVVARADQLNNHALSLLDLGRTADAEAVFQQALAVDPRHPEVVYNSGLLRWRAGTLTDDALVAQLESVRTTTDDGGRVSYPLALVHLERGDLDAAVPLLHSAGRQASDDAETAAVLRLVEQGDVPTWHCLRTLHADTTMVSVSFSPDGHFALTGGYDGAVQLWEMDSGRCLRTFTAHTSKVRSHTYGRVTSLCFSPDGQTAFAGIDDGPARLLDLTGTCDSMDLGGHNGKVTAACFSRDGRRILTAGEGRTAQWWDVASGTRLATASLQQIPPPSQHPTEQTANGWPVRSLWISPDNGRALICVENDVWQWDFTGNARRLVTVPHSDPAVPLSHFVGTACFSQDGRRVLTGGIYGNMQLWDLDSQRCLRTYTGHSRQILRVCFSLDGRRALTGGEDKTVRLWDLDSGRCLRTLIGSEWRTEAVCFSPDGRRALTGFNRTLRLWELPHGGYLSSTRLCRPRPPTELARLEARMEKLLDQAERCTARRSFPEAAAALDAARAIPGHERSPQLTQAGQRAGLFATRVGLRAAWLTKALDVVSSVKWASFWHDSRRIATASYFPGKPRVIVWDADTGVRVNEFNMAPSNLWATPDRAGGYPHNGALVIGGRHMLIVVGRSAWLWELGNYHPMLALTVPRREREIRSACLSPDGRHALTRSDDGTARLWDLATGRCLRVLTGRRVSLDETTRERYLGHVQELSVRFSASSRYALTGSDDGTVRLWDLATGGCLRRIELDGKVGSKVTTLVCSSPTGRYAIIVVGYGGDPPQLWDVVHGRRLCTLTGHTGWVTAVCFSPDGRHALSGGNDGTARLWDLHTGRCLHTLAGHRGGVASVCFSPDGSFALSGSADGTARLWELDWQLHARQAADWDPGAAPYLQTFLAQHVPNGAKPRRYGPFAGRNIRRALSCRGVPSWTEADFTELLQQLQHAGYGWLRPDGVRTQLESMARDWRGIPALPIT